MLFFRHPIIILLDIILGSIFGPMSFIEAYVHSSLFFLLLDFDYRSPWETLGAMFRQILTMMISPFVRI